MRGWGGMDGWMDRWRGTAAVSARLPPPLTRPPTHQYQAGGSPLSLSLSPTHPHTHPLSPTHPPTPGWWLERQQAPASLHVAVMPHHREQTDSFLLDLRACVENVRRRGGRAVGRKGKAAIYQGRCVGGMWCVWGGGGCAVARR